MGLDQYILKVNPDEPEFEEELMYFRKNYILQEYVCRCEDIEIDTGMGMSRHHICGEDMVKVARKHVEYICELCGTIDPIIDRLTKELGEEYDPVRGELYQWLSEVGWEVGTVFNELDAAIKMLEETKCEFEIYQDW